MMPSHPARKPAVGIPLLRTGVYVSGSSTVRVVVKPRPGTSESTADDISHLVCHETLEWGQGTPAIGFLPPPKIVNEWGTLPDV